MRLAQCRRLLTSNRPANISRQTALEDTMTQQLNPYTVAPDGIAALLGVEKYIHGSGLDPRLLALVRTRVSQINGCAYCLHMHTEEARKAGESDMRLHLLDAWQEFAPLLRPRTRRAGMGRVAHEHFGDTRTRRGLRAGAQTILREGARESFDRHRHDQCLEPARDRLEVRASRRPRQGCLSGDAGPTGGPPTVTSAHGFVCPAIMARSRAIFAGSP